MVAAGIAGATFHTLRHTAGFWAQGGASESEVAKLLGHATTQTTRRYVHLQHSHLRATVKTLDAVVRGVDTSVDTSAPKATPKASENRAKVLPTV